MIQKLVLKSDCYPNKNVKHVTLALRFVVNLMPLAQSSIVYKLLMKAGKGTVKVQKKNNLCYI